MRALFSLGLLVCVVAQYDCTRCPGSASVCCDCCVDGVLTLALCNDAEHFSCWPTVTPTFSSTGTSVPSETPTISATTTYTAIVTGLPQRGSNAVFLQAQSICGNPAQACGASEPVQWDVPPSVRNITVRMWGAGGSGDCGQASLTVSGAAGAYIEGILETTPGETLVVSPGAFNLCAGGGMSTIQRVQVRRSLSGVGC